jgi:uncharacterized protein (DUF2267 family)
VFTAISIMAFRVGITIKTIVKNMTTKTISPANRSSERNGRSNVKRTALNFEKYAEEGNRFINDVADELGASRNTAARITKAVLHAVRDRLSADDAVEFAQGLPMALKGVFIDQWDISDNPVVIRRAHDFLDYIYYKDEFTAAFDFPSEDSVEEGLRGVFNVLECYMDEGQIEQVKMIMGDHITRLIEGEMYYDRNDPEPI